MLYEDDRIKELNLDLAKRVFKQWAIPAVQSGNKVKFRGRRIPVVSSRYLQYATTYAKWNHFVTPNLARNIQIGTGIPDQAYVDGDPVLFSFKDITTGKNIKELTMATESEVIFDIEHLAKQNLDASSGTPLCEDFAVIKQQEPVKPQETTMPATNGEKKDKGADKTEKATEKQADSEKKTKKASKDKTEKATEKQTVTEDSTVQPAKESSKTSDAGKDGTTEVNSKASETPAKETTDAEPEKPTKKRRAPSANPKPKKDKKAKTSSPPESPHNIVLNVPANVAASSDGPKSSSTDAVNKANILNLLRKVIEHPKFDKSKNPLNLVPTAVGTWPTSVEGKSTLMNLAHIVQHYFRGELGYNTNSVDPELDAMFS